VTVTPNALPSAPTGLQAIAGDTRIALTWTAVSGAVSYRVYRGTSANSEAATPVANNVASASYTDAGLTNGTTYFYYVTAVNGTGESIRSNEASATPAPIPAVPTALTATAGNAQVHLSWTASATAASYNVYRATAGGTLVMISTVGAVTGTTYTDAGLTNGTTYYYVVTATNGAGSSASSNQASATPQAPPQAPIGLSATPGNTQAILSWNAPAPAVSWNPAADRVSSYTLKRSQTKGGPYTTTVTKTVNTGYTDTGLTNGTTYYYVVVATSAGGDGPASNEAAATPQVPAVGAPVITATDPGGVMIPAGGRFNGSLTVSLQVATPNAQIYYTLNGSTPSASSTLYSGASFTLSATTTVKAVAILSGGSSSAVSSATFTLNRLPSVSLTAPVDGATLHTGDALTLAATASDSNGTILQVEFFQGTASLGKATALPYTTAWLNAPAGTYALTAVATDNDGGRTISAPVTVTIANGLRSTPIACAQGFIGTLSTQEGTSPTLGAGHAAHLYTFTAPSGAVVTLSLNSGAFAGYLALRDPSGNIVAQADAGNAGGTAQITYTVPAGAGGSYTVEVTSSAPGAGGSYTVQLDCGAVGAVPGIAVSTSSGLNVANGGTVDFGATPLGVPITKTFTVTNTGSADLALTSFGGSGDSFTATSAPSSPLPPQASTTFTVRFTPGSNGAKTGTVTLGNNTAGSPFTINLTGTGGTGPALTVTALMLNPTSVAGGGKSVGTVTLSGPAPAGGQAVSLASTAGATVQSSVVVPQGQTSATFTVTAGAAAAQATLTASIGATGQTGFSSRSATLTITPAGTSPTVSLAADPTSAGAPATITLTATARATTSGAKIVKVEFFQGTVKIGEVLTSPYVFSWKSVQGGTYSLTARATDSNGLTATSAAVSVTITSTPSLPAPTLSPNGGTFAAFPTVTLSDVNPATGQPTGATIFYTTDGTVPDATKLRYTQPFVLPGTPITVQARAFLVGYTPSPTAQAQFAVTAASLGAAPAVVLTGPADGAEITNITAVTGTVTSSGPAAWEMDYQSVGDLAWVPFASGVAAGGNAVAVTGRLDTTLLLNGQYAVRLSAVDTAGRAAEPLAAITLVVKGGLKLGDFTFSVNDLTVPAAGFPVTITRTYDSRDKRQGDFGVGWRLSTTDLSLQKSSPSGYNWTSVRQGTNFYYQPVKAHVITITAPGGATYSFREGLAQSGFSVFQTSDVNSTNVIYTPLPGTHAALTPAGVDSFVLLSSDSHSDDPNGSDPNGIELEDLDGNVYAPTEFVLTLRDGRQLDLVQGQGLMSARDLNGNTLTFSRDGSGAVTGIQSTGGRSVTITRSGGVITGISDAFGPNVPGHTLVYAPDGSGNLASVTDRAGNTTSFDYDPAHYLTAIHDARGLLPIRNFYTPEGRLDYSLDVHNNRIGYTYPAEVPGGTGPASTESTFDRLGNQTRLGYDGYGNVTSATRYLKRADGSLDHAITTTARYADPNNPDKKTQDTDALGRQTDYQYNAQGDLKVVTQYKVQGDPTSAITTKTDYNGFGQPLTVTDPLDHVVSTNAYDGAGNLKSTMDALGHATLFDYNPNGTLAQTTDAQSHITRYGYYPSGDVASVTDAAGHVTGFTYDANSNKQTQTTTRTNAQGQTETLTTLFAYDNDDRLTGTVAPDGATSQTFYTSLGKVDYTLDALERKTSHIYDDLSQPLSTTYPDGTTTSGTYDANGQRVSSTDKTGRVSATAYDSLGRVTRSGPVNPSAPFNADGTPDFLKDAQGNALTSLTTYDDAGQVTQEQDALGRVSRSYYDDLGRKMRSTDALNFTTKYEYDDAGQQVKVTDANNHATLYDYDDAGRLKVTHYHDGSMSKTDYDELGRRVSQTDQADHATLYDYDDLGRLVKVTDPLSHISRFGYDELGEKISQTDANGHVTQFAYDNRGRLVSKMLPLNQTDGRSYDTLGRLSTLTDFNGKVTAFGYDPLSGRLLSKTAYASFTDYQNNAPTGESVSFTYLPDGTRRTATRTTAGGASVTTTYAYYGYDANGNPIPDFRQGQIKSVMTTAGGVSRTVSYDYNVLGEKISTQTPSLVSGNKNVAYGYDVLGRLSTVTHPDGAITTFGYDKVGNRQSVTRKDASSNTFSTTSYAYDSLNRLTDLINQDGNRAVLSSFHYELRLDGKRQSVTDAAGVTTRYTYDDAGKLTQEAGPYGTITYRYDSVGNRVTRSVTGAAVGGGTTLTNGTTTNAYDANDRITAQSGPGGMVNHSYDDAGNETTVNGQLAAYDFENHLVSLNSGATSYVYDADGNRVSVTSGGVATGYVVDTRLPYASVVEEYSGTTLDNGTLAARYDYGDDLVRMDRTTPSVSTSYYLYDGLGSTRQLVNTGGTVTDTWGYSAFGELASHMGSTVNPFLFNAQQFDQPTGTYFLRARYYDQSNGRFLSQDPFGGHDEDPVTLHRYLYAANEPTDRVDPGGEEETLVGTQIANFGLASLTASIAGGLTNVVVDVSVSLAFGENYSFTDGLQSFAVGFITEGAVAILGKSLQLITLAAKSHVGPLFVHGIERYSTEIVADGGRHWATTIQEIKNKSDFFRIGGNFRMLSVLKREIKDLGKSVGVPAEDLEKYMPAYSPHLWSWWKGALGQYSYQAWGPARFKFALLEGLATILELRAIRERLEIDGHHIGSSPSIAKGIADGEDDQ